MRSGGSPAGAFPTSSSVGGRYSFTDAVENGLRKFTIPWRDGQLKWRARTPARLTAREDDIGRCCLDVRRIGPLWSIDVKKKKRMKPLDISSGIKYIWRDIA